MDPLSITTGVLTLLGTCIKVYITSFRHEIHLLLLRNARPDDETAIEEMLSDSGHPEWQNRLLQEKIALEFGKAKEGLLKDVIEDIRTSLSELQEDLRCFDSLKAGQHQGEKMKDTIRRLRDRVKVA
ncbi:hypothetical protein RB594_008194 [Gaeumannomyces avenae]